jgi:hypothetical protein
MRARLRLQKRVDAPAAVKPNLDAASRQMIQQVDDARSGHARLRLASPSC